MKSWFILGFPQQRGRGRVFEPLFLSFTEQTEVVALRQPRHAVPLLVEEVEKLPWFAHLDFSHQKVNRRGRKLTTRRWASEDVSYLLQLQGVGCC